MKAEVLIGQAPVYRIHKEPLVLRYFPLIVKNSRRNRRRSLLTMSSIAVSLCLLGMLMAMYRALFLDTQPSPAQALRLVTHHRVSITHPMPVSYTSKIKQIPGVRDAMIWQWIGGTYKDARDPRNVFPRFAVEPDKFFGIMGEIKLPEAQMLDFIRIQTACIVGKKLAAKFNWKPGDRITVIGDIFPVDLILTIVGIYNDPEETENLFFNYRYLRELQKNSAQGPRADEVGVFMVQANRPSDVAAVAEAIDKEFEKFPRPHPQRIGESLAIKLYLLSGRLEAFSALHQRRPHLHCLAGFLKYDFDVSPRTVPRNWGLEGPWLSTRQYLGNYHGGVCFYGSGGRSGRNTHGRRIMYPDARKSGCFCRA